MKGKRVTSNGEAGKQRKIPNGIHGESHIVKSPPLPSDMIRYHTGWVFTVSDELRMRRACRDAASFMSGYGKGRTPYMVDTTHYENSSNTTL